MAIPTSPEWAIFDFTDDQLSNPTNGLLQAPSPFSFSRLGPPYIHYMNDHPPDGNDCRVMSNDGTATSILGAFNVPNKFTFECKFKLVHWPKTNHTYTTNRLLFAVYDKQSNALGIMLSEAGIAYISPGRAPEHLVPPSGFNMTPGNYYYFRGVMEDNGTLLIYITDSLEEFTYGQRLRYTLSAEQTGNITPDGVFIDILGTNERPTEINISTLKLHNSDTQPNRLPIALATPDIVVPVNLNCALDGSTSYDPEGIPLLYEWTVLSSPVEPVALNGNIKASTVFFPGQPHELTFSSVIPGHYGTGMRVALEVTGTTFSIIVNENAGPTITFSLPDDPNTTTDDILDALTRVGHPAYNARASELVSAEETGTPSSWIPPTALTTQELIGGVDSTDAITAFTPTTVGEYVIQLKVSDGAIESEPWTTIVSVIEGNVVLGDVPSASYIWDYLLDSYQRIENKEIFDTIWSGLLQEAANVLLRTWQTQYNLSLHTIQDTIMLKWAAFRIREELTEYTLTVPTGWNPALGTSDYNDATGVPTRIGVELASPPAAGTFCGISTGNWLIDSSDHSIYEVTEASYPNQSIRTAPTPPTYTVPTSGNHLYALDDGDGDPYTDQVEFIGESVVYFNVPIPGSLLYIAGTGPYTITECTTKTMKVATKSIPISYQNAVWEVRIPITTMSWVVPPYLTFTEDMEHPPIYGDKVRLVRSASNGTAMEYTFTVLSASERVICFENTTQLTGEVIVVAGSKIVQGSGTAFNLEIAQGDWVEIAGEVHQVDSIADAYTLLLKTPHAAGATVAGIYWHLTTEAIEASHIYLLRLARAYCHEDIVYIPRIQYTTSSITDPTSPYGGTLYNGIDYLLADGEGYIDFIKTPYLQDESDYIWAEVIYLTNNTAVEAHFGALIGVYKDDIKSLDPTLSYLNVIKSLYFGLYRGPSVKNIETGTGALLGMPITEAAGYIEEINPNATPTLGRIVVRDANNSPFVRTYFFRTGLTMAINEETGLEFAVGDYVEQFTLMTSGVDVSDWVNDPDWFVPYAEAGYMQEAEKLFLFMIRVNADAMSTSGMTLIAEYIKKLKPSYSNFVLVVAKTLQDEIDITADLSDYTSVNLRIRDDLHTSPDTNIEGLELPEFSLLSPTVFGNLDPVTLEPVFDNGYWFSWYGLPYRSTYYDPAVSAGFNDPQWEQDPSGAPYGVEFIWVAPIRDKDLTTAPILGAGDAGARYIVGGLGGAWSGFALGDVATWDGAAWSAVTPVIGWLVIEEDSGLFWYWSGTEWIAPPRKDLLGGYDYSWGCVEGNGSWYPHPETAPPPPPGREFRTPLRYGHNYSWQDGYEDGDPMSGHPEYTLSSIGRNINIGPTDVPGIAQRMVGPPVPIYSNPTDSVSVFGNLDPVTLEPIFTNGYWFTWFGLPFRNTYYNPSVSPGFDDPQWEQDQTGPIMTGWLTNIFYASSRRHPLAPSVPLTLEPSPIIYGITPESASPGSGLTISGSGFRTGSIIRIGGIVTGAGVYAFPYWVGIDLYEVINVTIPAGVPPGPADIEIVDPDLQTCTRHGLLNVV